MKKLAQLLLRIQFLFLFAIFFCFPVGAQDIEVSGLITETSSSTPIEGVSVIVKGTGRGTVTDSKGIYRIHAKANDVLMFSYSGYESSEMLVGNNTQINIRMKPSSSQLDDVVVVGYGKQRKASLTGSVASIGSKDIKRSPALSVSNAIAGLLPGVITLNRSGEPGKDDAQILIRGKNTTGNNNPLVVVDGVPDAPGWQRINSNDIESISVLKDAAAAIYGARAANGVILITTKRGTTGKPIISYTYNQGFNQPTRLPEMANSATFAGYVNELLIKAGQQPRFTDSDIQKFADGSDPLNYPSVNWFKEVIKSTTLQSQQNINLRGGTEAVKYSFSGSYANQNDIFKNGSTKFKTYSIRSNVDIQATKNLKLGFDVNGAIEDGNYPPYGKIATTFGRLQVSPFIPVYYPNGLPSAGIKRGENPIMMASDASGNNNENAQRISVKASFDLALKFVKGLSLDGYANYNNNVYTTKKFRKSWTVYNYDKANDTYIPVTGGVSPADLNQSYSQNKTSLINLRIKYERRFENHQVNAFIAAEQLVGFDNTFSAFRRNFVSTSLDELFAGSLKDQAANGFASENGRKNLFGRISYAFKDKYLADVNFRYDGSSIFKKGNQYGFFPGISAAWRVSKEKFIQDNVDFLDDLKLRASYGKIGNDQVPAFQFLSVYSLGTQGYNFGQSPVQSQGLVAGVTPNPNITWEVAAISNIGIDATLWNGLFGFTVDLFKQKRSNILATRALSVPYYTGLTLPNENIGVVQNKGIEIELRHAKNFGDFSYHLSGNFTYSKNKIIDISEASNVPLWQKAEGHTIDAQTFYHAIGIFRTQTELDAAVKVPGTVVGDLKYEDINKDGTITSADMIRMDKTNTPEVVFGFNISTEYKRFSLFANFSGQSKSWQFLQKLATLDQNTLQDIIENRYTPGSLDSKYPILPTSDAFVEVSGLRSDFWLQDASFVRLKTLEIGYVLPESILSKAGINSMRLYLNGNNLFTIDKLKWYDPEGSQEAGDFYPQSKIYNIGLSLTF